MAPDDEQKSEQGNSHIEEDLNEFLKSENRSPESAQRLMEYFRVNYKPTNKLRTKQKPGLFKRRRKRFSGSIKSSKDKPGVSSAYFVAIKECDEKLIQTLKRADQCVDISWRRCKELRSEVEKLEQKVEEALTRKRTLEKWIADREAMEKQQRRQQIYHLIGTILYGTLTICGIRIAVDLYKNGLTYYF